MLTLCRRLPELLVVTLAALAAPAWAADTDIYLPNNTEGVVTVNVKQMLEAPLVKNNLDTIKALLLASGNAQKMLDDLGFDPFTDVDRVVVAIDPDVSKSATLVHGKFDPAKIGAKAEKAAKENPDVLKIVKAGDYTIYEVKPPEQNETLYVAIVDSGTIFASPSKAAVVDALDKKAGTKQAELKKEMQALLAKIDPKQSISIVTLGGPLMASGQPIAAKIQNIVGGVTITDEVQAEIVLNTKDADDATAVESELKESVDQIKALVDLTATQNKELKPLVDAMNTMKLAVEGSAVSLKAQLTKEVINKLMPK
jgi:hypothetical protein